MTEMKTNKIFLDSNILVYLVDGNAEGKKNKVQSLLSPDFIISTQVVNENVSACVKSKKKSGLGLSKKEAFAHGRMLMQLFSVKTITSEIIENAFYISEKLQFSIWDSLIVATALEYDCTTLYSEDLTDGQVIENKLTIVNPLK